MKVGIRPTPEGIATGARQNLPMTLAPTFKFSQAGNALGGGGLTASRP